MAKSSEAQIRAVVRYSQNHYKTYSLYLRIKEDYKIIASIELAKANGIPIRVWLREHLK